MAQDLKKLMQDRSQENPKLSAGHEARFAKKLESAFGHEAKKSGNSGYGLPWMKVAAIAVVLITAAFFGYKSLSGGAPEEITIADTQPDPRENTTIVSKQMTLGDISPDLKKVEDFYMAGINVQLASLEITQDNKDVIDGYMEQLGELDKEYNMLNEELNIMGPTEATITALIDNLKLRLDLLFKLKNKLKELKNQNNEQYNSIQT